MYRAKVEQVDGWRVLAGGKWLRCIGNRRVRVGDFIWTDGSCVYGYDKVSSQPLVIANPIAELLGGIPIITQGKFYTYYKNVLQDSGVSISETIHKGMITQLTNDKKGATYLSKNNTKIVASNVDVDGNLYYIRLDNDKINIFKNGVIVKSVDLPIEEKKVHSIEPSGYYIVDIYAQLHFDEIPIDDFNEYNVYTKYFKGLEIIDENRYEVNNIHTENSSNYVDWAYIKNANEWGLAITNATLTRDERPYATFNRAYGTGYYGNDLYYGTAVLNELILETSMTTHLIDNSGTTRILFSANQQWHQWEGTENPYKDYYEQWAIRIAKLIGVPQDDEFPTTEETGEFTYNLDTEISKIKFPIHEGFFVIDKLSAESDNYFYSYAEDPFSGQIYSRPDYYDISVFNRSNKKVLTNLHTHLTNLSLITDNHYSLMIQDKNLFELRNGVWTKILNSTLNQCLRPMKNYKNWWEHLTEFG